MPVKGETRLIGVDGLLRPRVFAKDRAGLVRAFADRFERVRPGLPQAQVNLLADEAAEKALGGMRAFNLAVPSSSVDQLRDETPQQSKAQGSPAAQTAGPLGAGIGGASRVRGQPDQR